MFNIDLQQMVAVLYIVTILYYKQSADTQIIKNNPFPKLRQMKGVWQICRMKIGK